MKTYIYAKLYRNLYGIAKLLHAILYIE